MRKTILFLTFIILPIIFCAGLIIAVFVRNMFFNDHNTVGKVLGLTSPEIIETASCSEETSETENYINCSFMIKKQNLEKLLRESGLEEFPGGCRSMVSKDLFKYCYTSYIGTKSLGIYTDNNQEELITFKLNALVD